MIPLKCINCFQFVSEEDVYRNKQHSRFIRQQLVLTRNEEAFQACVPCVCCECVFYRVETCFGCGKVESMCMYSLEQWFTTKSHQRRCLDCTAYDDTTLLMSVVKSAPASRYIMQCIECLDFKLLCSFLLLHKELGNGRRAVREGNQGDGGICLKCVLGYDIANYKQALYDKHRLDVSADPLPGKVNSEPQSESIQMEASLPVMSYAKAVSGEQILEIPRPRELKTNVALVGRGPEFFIASLQDFLCEIVNKILCNDIPKLLKKMELEMKLRNLPSSISTQILQKKIRRTSHSFSVQATEETNFYDPETRWAYIAIYTPVHASIVSNTLMHSKVTPLVELIETAAKSINRMQICCFGAGPGSEVLGLHNWFPPTTCYHLFDNCIPWQYNAKALVNKQLNLDFTYSYVDIMSSIEQSTADLVKESQLFTFVKFLSAIQNRNAAISYLRSIFHHAMNGSLFLFVDNCNHEIRQFIENFLFPNGEFERKQDCKESKEYRLYSTYSEFRFDIDDISSGSSNVFDWLNLLMEWVDRPPLVELRVFIFVVEKR